MKPLIELLRAVPEPIDYPAASASLIITHITSDSRKVKPGSLFVALKGSKDDGSKFIDMAISEGAVALLCETSTPCDVRGVAVLRSHNPRKALALMAAALHGKQPEYVVAVTGTDGKTSSCDFYRRMSHQLGNMAASIGTLGVLLNENEVIVAESQTTPPPEMLQATLAELADKNVRYLAMEASSHGLDQLRLDGVKLTAGAFTNIARDHLDYHQTEEAYFKAKSRLFTEVLPAGATAVINQDDAKFPILRDICKQRGLKLVGFGKTGEQFTIKKLTPTPHGQIAELVLHGKSYNVEVPLVGAFQLYNILTAVGLLEATGISIEQALSTIRHLKGVPGRLEHVATLANGAAVYIDYAHTPMALANILNTLRPHTHGKLHVVFGCGGDRDAGKRPQMGRIANELADVIIVTDDNPRSENPASIRAAIIAACARGKEIADRKEAIYAALKALNAGDILVIAGKGHEKTQIIGGVAHPFDDADVARRAAQELETA